MSKVEHYVITRITCSGCGGLGVSADDDGFLKPTCVMCGGKGHFVNETPLLDVLRKLKWTVEGDADGNWQYGFVTDVEIVDDTN